MSRYHEEESLPKWARELIGQLRSELAEQNRVMHNLQIANEVLADGHEWFTIQGPDFASGEEYRHLWFLNREQPFKACALFPGDVLLVGRKPPKKSAPPPPTE